MKRLDISNLRKNRSVHFQIGFIIALAVVVGAFTWTVEETALFVLDEAMPIDYFDEIPVVRTPREERPIVPPPSLELAAEVEAVESPDFIEEPEPEVYFDDVAPSNTEAVRPVPQPTTPPQPTTKPPLPEKETEASTIFKIVEEMPRFGDCASMEITKEERTLCSDKALLTYLSQHIKYPTIARENGIEGTVVVRFIIDENGVIEQAEVLKDIGGGCGKEALRVVQEMPNWTPGRQRTQRVKVQMNLPVRFKLQ